MNVKHTGHSGLIAVRRERMYLLHFRVPESLIQDCTLVSTMLGLD